MKKEKKPKYMLTWLCLECNSDFARTEKDKPRCPYCDKETQFVLISKEEITPELIAKRIKISTDRMMAALHGAWNERPRDDSETEKMLLETMAKADELRKKSQALKLKKQRKKK